MRPQILEGTTTKIKTACGNLYCTLNCNSSNDPAECFVTMGKAGSCVSALMQAISGLITMSLEHELAISEIIGRLKGIRCYRSSEIIPSCIDSISRSLSEKAEIK